MLEKIQELISKKLLAVLVTIIVIVLNQVLGLGLDDNDIRYLIELVLGYTVGQSLVDITKKVVEHKVKK